MSVGGRPAIPVAVQREFWAAIRSGMVVAEAASCAGVSITVAWRWFRHVGGVMPPDFSSSPQPVTVRRLSLGEREEIACRRAAGEGVRAIAVALGRSPSTISRELRRGTVRRKSGYRATVAQALADQRSRRPKARVLERNDRLREHVQNRLHAKDSPEQISYRLLIDYPDDQTMRISHETIYRCLYVQGRGGLRRELVTCLRTGRALRKPGRHVGQRKNRIPDMVNIAERPAEAADRAVPGHWEGDLITGAENKSAIGTLVERATGYVTLLHLPNGHGAEAVQEAMVEAMSHLPATLHRTLAWDQGIEMANHVAIASAAAARPLALGLGLVRHRPRRQQGDLAPFRLNVAVDETILGGFIARVRSRLIDASVASAIAVPLKPLAAAPSEELIRKQLRDSGSAASAASSGTFRRPPPRSASPPACSATGSGSPSPRIPPTRSRRTPPIAGTSWSASATSTRT